MPNSRHSGAIFSPSSRRAINFSRSSMGLHAFQGILRSPQKARLCNPCLPYELSPFSQEGQFTIVIVFDFLRYPASMSVVCGSNMEAATHLNSIWDHADHYNGTSSIRVSPSHLVQYAPLSNVWATSHFCPSTSHCA